MCMPSLRAVSLACVAGLQAAAGSCGCGGRGGEALLRGWVFRPAANLSIFQSLCPVSLLSPHTSLALQPFHRPHHHRVVLLEWSAVIATPGHREGAQQWAGRDRGKPCAAAWSGLAGHGRLLESKARVDTRAMQGCAERNICVLSAWSVCEPDQACRACRSTLGSCGAL